MLASLPGIQVLALPPSPHIPQPLLSQPNLTKTPALALAHHLSDKAFIPAFS